MTQIFIFTVIISYDTNFSLICHNVIRISMKWNKFGRGSLCHDVTHHSPYFWLYTYLNILKTKKVKCTYIVTLGFLKKLFSKTISWWCNPDEKFSVCVGILGTWNGKDLILYQLNFWNGFVQLTFFKLSIDNFRSTEKKIWSYSSPVTLHGCEGWPSPITGSKGC
jgi:hypothetical protein